MSRLSLFITAQLHVNKSDTDTPSWRKKGGVYLEMPLSEDLRWYSPEAVKLACIERLAGMSDDTEKVTYLSHEIRWENEFVHELDFSEKVAEYDRDLEATEALIAEYEAYQRDGEISPDLYGRLVCSNGFNGFQS